ncbi:MAG: histidinol-phosphate transaminase [Thermodesulfovibrionales bacterium]|nr:histidinol-phosphate transaminase [Thermodesulfovibrionales bacterium]
MRDINFSNIARDNIKNLQAYLAKEIPCKVKLDANESPYCPLPLDLILSRKEIFSSLNRYPNPEAEDLKRALAKDLRVSPHNILLGNGSDEIINYLISTFGGPVVYPVPTFVMYGITSQILGQDCLAIPLDKDFDLNLEEFLNTIKHLNPKLIFLSTPNNPTGNCFSQDKIFQIIEATSNIVIIDEAYQPYSKQTSFINFLKDYPNIAILRTFSKIGLAAIRVGFLIGHKDLITEVNKTRLPYNVNSISQAIAIESIKNKKTINYYIKLVIKERHRVFRELCDLRDVEPYPSEANFILFKIKNSDLVYKALLKRGVLIRNMNKVVDDALRVTIGTEEENSLFLEELKVSLRLKHKNDKIGKK